ncbi:unnamed protein product [Candida verbasci]|uniref:Arp2/3 complex 34 kDa subunit n=1 Tax=Candida verbasci TaxID=1227364 RepID=A0A9W4TVC1_9ASCO|nr:unnamed protein product [Candida verbasci]
MLQIEQNNLLIESTLTERIFSNTFKSLDRIVSDFDFTTYHLSSIENKTKILISINLKCWNDLAQYGVTQILSEKYQPFSSVLSTTDAEQGYNYSFILDLESAFDQDQDFKLSLINELSLLKRNSMAAPFCAAFSRYDELFKKYANVNTYSEEVQMELQNEKVIIIKYRGLNESIYLKPSFDRVTIIFSTMFQDETDKIFGKVFLQEFVDARKRSVQTAPQVLYNTEAPLDIANDVKKGEHFVTFVLFPRHLTIGDKRENCISHIQLFRSYFHYHIKCSKAYMHSRMRFRVKEFLKILNRAKPENLDDDGKVIETRKTASGRTFVK